MAEREAQGDAVGGGEATTGGKGPEIKISNTGGSSIRIKTHPKADNGGIGFGRGLGELSSINQKI